MILIWLRQGMAYGIMAVGWLLAFGVGVVVLLLIASALVALGDFLNDRDNHNKGGKIT